MAGSRTWSGLATEMSSMLRSARLKKDCEASGPSALCLRQAAGAPNRGTRTLVSCCWRGAGRSEVWALLPPKSVPDANFTSVRTCLENVLQRWKGGLQARQAALDCGADGSSPD
eukprot:748859-Hanusia_phi.AAC.1